MINEVYFPKLSSSFIIVELYFRMPMLFGSIESHLTSAFVLQCDQSDVIMVILCKFCKETKTKWIHE